MIKFTNVSFGFPQKDLYNKICFEIEEGEHAVLIGSNGTGKSTLIDMLLDDEKYLYEGKIETDIGSRVGLVSQFVKHETEEKTAFEYLAEPFVKIQAQSDEICKEMETAEDMEEVYGRYQLVLDEMEAMDAYNYETNIHKQLAVAGLTPITETSIQKVSGGEFKLLSIIRNMLVRPHLLIMDEPDVFLDFENLVGLSKLINGYKGTILTITHNRLLLNQCFNKVLHLENEELQEFPGSFAEYNRAMLETKTTMQEQADKDTAWIEIQEKLVDRLRDDATKITSPTKGRQLKARVSYLERLQARRTPNPFIEDHSYDFKFPEVETPEELLNEPVIVVENYQLTFDREILKDVSFCIRPGEKVAVVGANGTGKSSMMKDVYRDLMAKDPEAPIGYFTQIYEEDGEKLSGGERNIKQLREIMASQAELLFLDEPTSHLDIFAQMSLEKAIDEYKGTVVMVTHDFFLLADCADRILLLENGTLREMSGRSYRKSIYKKYFDSDIFEQERERKELEVRVNHYLKSGRVAEAKQLLGLE